MKPAITSSDFDKLFLESSYELSRALALFAATALMSEHLKLADDTTANALSQLFNDSASICQETAGKLRNPAGAR
jgi:hypothetical protein